MGGGGGRGWNRCRDDRSHFFSRMHSGDASVGRARVVGVTCNSAVSLNTEPFDVVIMDECSQCLEPLALVPLCKASVCRVLPV